MQLTTAVRGAPVVQLRALCRHRMPAAALARPTTVCVRAFQQGAAPPERNPSDAAANVSVSKRPVQEKPVTLQQRPAVARSLPSLLFNDFNEMTRRMDAMTRAFGLPSLLDDDTFFSPPSRLLRRAEAAAAPLEQQLSNMLHLATDIHEDATAFTIKADVPGMSKDAIKVAVQDGVLTISGERSEERSFPAEGGGAAAAAPATDSAGDSKEEGAAAAPGSEVATAPAAALSQPVRYERSYGSFQRSFRLPPNVDADGITATAKEGVLTVTLPKVPQEAPKAKEVPVE